MALMKCNYCGGETEIDIGEGKAIGVCKYCESMMTIPKQLGRKGNLYNRAVFLRQNNEFDSAESIYEDMLREDNTDAEAHWGLALSKYGIEYVEDPSTKERIPTCHRMLLQTILADHDYQAALKEADEASRQIMEREGERIDQIQRRIMEISRQEKPYDVFICYKETDEVGSRTEDSVLAQEIYQELEKKYRVFFSRKTLENKLGVEFEPIIYAALSSASVMVVVGTKPEHFKAVWVRNEWSRFLKMSKEKPKTVIPVYRGMSPYELPAELASFQGQDMGKIGGMQDLLDGVDRCMRHKKSDSILTQGTLSTAKGADRLIEKGEIYLKLKNYEEARESYLRATKQYPEDYRGWWGMIASNTLNLTQVAQNQKQLDQWFECVRRLTDEETLQQLAEQYAEYLRKVADRDAEAEIKVVKTIIEKSKERLNDLRNKKSVLYNEISECERQMTDAERRSKANVEKQMAYIAELKKRRNKKSVARVGLGLCVFVFLVLLIIDVGLALGSFLLIMFPASFCMDTIQKIPKFEEIDKSIYLAQEQIRGYERDLEQSKEDGKKRIWSINNQANELTSQIEGCAAMIVKKQRYIALGKEKLTEYWFVSRCAGAGMNLECDPQLLKARDEIYA